MILKTLALGSLGLAIAVGTYVRMAPLDPDVWHTDPETAERPGTPNDFLLGPGGDVPALATDVGPTALFNRLDRDLMRQPGVSVLKLDPVAHLYTYVQRSKLMGYPDIINIRITPEGQGSRLSIWSRSRYGQSDLGVNKARVEAMLTRTGLS